MSLARRLEAVEQQVAAASVPDPDAQAKVAWKWFWEFAQRVLEPSPEALADARRAVAGNQCVWQPTGAKPRIKCWVLQETVWAALGRHPEAKRALNAALDAGPELPAEVEAALNDIWADAPPTTDPAADDDDGWWDTNEERPAADVEAVLDDEAPPLFGGGGAEGGESP
jgi:hypothetical protein